jgi:AcrR family transcriptional regulator
MARGNAVNAVNAGAAHPSSQPADPPAAPGRRESNKRAVRAALQQSADRLFAEQGVPGTTVREIAEAAGVTERTFFRYFRSKEDLIIGDAFAWMPALERAVLSRPVAEPPLVAVRRALASVMDAITRIDGPSPFALWMEAAPADRVGIAGRTIMLRLEAEMADLIGRRLAADGRPAPRTRPRIDPRLRAQVLGRESVAAFRSAMLFDLQLRRDGVADRPSLAVLLDQAFAALESAAPAPRTPPTG